jgi:hypothetical protein
MVELLHLFAENRLARGALSVDPLAALDEE